MSRHSLEGIDATQFVGTLFRAHARGVYRTARCLGVPASDVDDVVQEVFVIAHRKSTSFTAGSSERAWLRAICIRVVAAWRRRAVRRHERVVETFPDLVEQATPEMHTASLRLLARALESLDEDKRAVFVLAELEELDMAEVAQALGCRLKTAYSRLYAAREIFAREIAKEQP